MIPLRAKTIAIIGAGPSGLIAAKYFRAEKAFDQIDVIEQRSSPGGIWNYTPHETEEDLFTVPRTDPHVQGQRPVWRTKPRTSGDGSLTNGFDHVDKEASFLSPIYDRLETNIPRGLMGFQDLNWPQDSQLFPKHQTVLEYIQGYGKDVLELVRFETQVIHVEATDTSERGGWSVRTRNLRSSEEAVQVYDAVVVANGHFIVPYVPDLPHIREWNEMYPGAISHSKYFRRPEDYAGKKVVVVGNSASGVDISSQIATVSARPLLWSSRSMSMLRPAPDANKRERPPIVRFLAKSRGVEFEDGAVETDIDAVVFATGYLYSLPFLETVEPKLIGDGSHVQNTYQHLFYAPRPTLAFLALNQRVIPFPLAEAQSAALARVYSGRLSLPSYAEMRRWEEETLSESGRPKDFHLLPFPKDGNYINALSGWALSATTREGLDHAGEGKRPPIWGEWEFWCRENFPAIRAAFGAKGEERYSIRTLDELGFEFQKHLEGKKYSDNEKLI